MPLRKVIRETYTVKEKVVAAECNCCGKVGEPEGICSLPYGFHVWNLEGGWGDSFPGDMEQFQIVVCEDCLKAWVGTFEHPEIRMAHRYHGVIEVTEARHSGTDEVLLVETGWLRPLGTLYPEETPVPEYPEEYPPEDSVWQHFKGQRYLVRGLVAMVGTCEWFVYYQALYGESEGWVRPLSEWYDTIDRETYKGPRFKQMP